LRSGAPDKIRTVDSAFEGCITPAALRISATKSGA
jgi:hypothetical protein